MAPMREACAVLLLRGDLPDPEVYVVRRSPKLRFFGGAWAFPGGVMDAMDGSAEEESARRACALRELFEETGVLPAEMAEPGAEQRAAVRAGLLADEEAARALWQHWLEAAPAAIEALEHLGRLTTPAFAPVRYRTDFFRLRLPPGEHPRIEHGELVDGAFVRPAELEQWFVDGERAVVPPARFLVGCLQGRTEPEFRRELDRRFRELVEGGVHPVDFRPGVRTVPLETRTLPPATTTNCHLLGTERIHIIDPAPTLASEQQRLLVHLEQLLGQGRRLESVLLTHHHPDHVGAAAVVASRFGIPVLAHPETLSRVPLDGLAVQPLHGGERLELGRAPDGREGWGAQVLHTPGHAPGHLCLVEDRYLSWIAGDLVSTLSTIVIDPEDGHLATYLQSLRGLLDRPLGTCLPAHGPAAPDSHAVIRRLLAHRQQREQRLVAALGIEPRGLSELVAEVYDDVGPELHPIAERSLRSGLIKLEEEGRAARQGEGWVRRGDSAAD